MLCSITSLPLGVAAWDALLAWGLKPVGYAFDYRILQWNWTGIGGLGNVRRETEISWPATMRHSKRPSFALDSASCAWICAGVMAKANPSRHNLNRISPPESATAQNPDAIDVLPCWSDGGASVLLLYNKLQIQAIRHAIEPPHSNFTGSRASKVNAYEVRTYKARGG